VSDHSHVTPARWRAICIGQGARLRGDNDSYNPFNDCHRFYQHVHEPRCVEYTMSQARRSQSKIVHPYFCVHKHGHVSHVDLQLWSFMKLTTVAEIITFLQVLLCTPWNFNQESVNTRTSFQLCIKRLQNEQIVLHEPWINSWDNSVVNDKLALL
jgi:hypothetical protein